MSVEAPDGRGRSLAERVCGIERATRDRKVLLIGSSYGGLAAAHVADQYPERFFGLLLLAPALHRIEIPVLEPSGLRPPLGVPTMVIHGIHDDVVPVSVSRRYCARSHAELTEVDDDHRLALSMPCILEATQRLLQINETTLDVI